MSEQQSRFHRKARVRRPVVPLTMVVLLALPGLSACDAWVTPEERIERAAAEFEAGDLSASMKDVKTALESQPDNPDGRALLARISLRLGDFEGARKELDRAIEAGADPASLRDLHYAIFLAQGRYEDALIALQADDGAPDLLRSTVAAKAQLALGRYDEARASLDTALKLAPDDPEVLLAEARWLWSTGKIDELKSTLDRLVERFPDLAAAHVLQGRVAMAEGDGAQAAEAFARAQKTAGRQLDVPEQLTILVGLTESKLVLGDLAGAETHLKALEARAPDGIVTLYLKARLAYARRDFDAAAAELQRALARRPDNTPARLLLGAVLIDKGALEQAGAELGKLVAEQPENIEARKLLARAYLARNDTIEARKVLAETPAGAAGDPGADWMSGSILLTSGQTEEGIALLEQAAAADPGNAALQVELARVYLSTGRPERALQVLEALPPGEGGMARQQITLLAEVSGKSPAEAQRVISTLVAERPRDVGLLMVAGAYLGSIGLIDPAEELFRKALAVDAAKVDAWLGLAAIAMQRGDPGTAKEHLQKAIEVDSTHEPVYVGLAEIALAGGDRDEARDWLERAISAKPSAVESRLRLAELAYADNDPSRGAALLDQAIEVSQAKAATLNRAGLILLKTSNFDQALMRFNEAAALGFQDAGVNAATAMLALGQEDEARGRLMAATQARPNWLAPVRLLTQIDLKSRRYVEALNRIAAFEKAGGAKVAADDLRGTVLFAAGRYGESADAFARAVEAQPSAPLAVKLYRARKAAGRAQPEESLRDWLEGHPQDALVRVMLAEHVMQQGDLKDAIAQYELVPEKSQGPVVLNNLAWLYQQTGDDRAADLARRAHEMAPDRAEIADTYGWILLGQGKVDEAVKILEAAASGAAGNPQIQYHYAAALARAGRNGEAMIILRKLLDGDAAFRSRPDAERLMQSLAAR